ncbi:MAG: HD domain-containing protein [Planctomycetaceae bacterium]|nr:HD domain-containing protein [Planctomycetaceae bacterium]
MHPTRANATPHPVTEQVLRFFRERGGSQYGQEAVTQLEHALQVALLAEQAGASPSLIAAGLLHDLGHLLHNHPDDAPDQGIDDRHEELAGRWLERRFGSAVTEPVRLHVAAKRYLCTVEPEYRQLLSGPSLTSLELQGGTMTPEEVAAFRAHEHSAAAVLLRRWDDAAKIPKLPTPSIEHFARYIDQALASEAGPLL